MSFFLHEVRYKRDSKHLFFQLLSILFSVLVRILKLFFSHHLCITLCRIQKYKFYWCKTTTAWVIGIGPQFSCTWPQCASSLQLILASFATTCQQLIAISDNPHVRTANCYLCLPLHLTLFYVAPEYHTCIWYSIPDFKKVLKNLWRHFCFINLKTYV